MTLAQCGSKIPLVLAGRVKNIARRFLIMVTNSIQPTARAMFAGVVTALVLSGCMSMPEPLPGDDVRAKLAVARIAITTSTQPSAVRTPLRGWAAVGAGAGEGAIAVVVGIPILFLWAPVGAVGGAVGGALNSRSETDIATAVAVFKEFEEGLRPEKEIREHLLVEASKLSTQPQLSFLERGSPNDAASDVESGQPNAGVENILTIVSGYRICGSGIINPDLTVIFTEEAFLAGAGPTSDPIFHRRWELKSQSMNYFDAMKENAKLLHAEFDNAYAKLAERMVNDLYAAPPAETHSNPSGNLVHTIPVKGTFETCH